MVKKDKKELQEIVCDIPSVDYDPISNCWIKRCGIYVQMGVKISCNSDKYYKCKKAYEAGKLAKSINENKRLPYHQS